MRTQALIICLLAYALIGSATELQNCLGVVQTTAVFNLCPLANSSLIYTVNDAIFGTIEFSLATGHVSACSGSDQVWATINDGTCETLANNSPDLALQDSSDENSGLVMTFNQQSYSRNLVVQLGCTDESDLNINFTVAPESLTSTNTIFITGKASYGCPTFTLSQIVSFLEDNKVIFIVVGVILGLFLLFFGLKMFKIAVFIVTLVAATLFCGMVFFEFVKFGAQEWIRWLIFAVCILIGAALGYLAVRYERIGFFFLGAALGAVGGLILYNAVLVHVMEGKTALFYVVIVILGLIGGGLGLWLWKDIIIIGTSLIGSYLAVRSVSVVIGGFPNEIAIAQGVITFSWYTYAYLAVIGVLFILGLWIQFREKRRQEEEEEPKSTGFYRNV